MNPEDKKEESQTSNQPQNGKLQRKLKFKTLDGNIKTLECDYDIKISDLKKKLEEIYKIEPIRQRLLNKGKQFKDDEYLDKLVDKDDTTIHLVFRSEADVKRMQEQPQNTTNNNQANPQGQNQNNQNISPFQNILNLVANSFNNNNGSNNYTTNATGTINIGNTQYQTLNIGEALNLSNSPLHPIAQQPNLPYPPPYNLNNNTNSTETQNTTQNTNNETTENVNKNNYSSQFPILSSVTDKKYEQHLKNIETELNKADELISQKIEPRIPLPLLNTTQNVFTAISRSLRKYVIVNQNVLCHLMRLADLMEREQFITNSEARMTGNKLLDQAYKSLSHISKASNDLSNVIKSSNFNTAPNTGYIGIVCQEIGVQSTAIPIELGNINTNNILAALGGTNANNNNANNISQGQAQVNVQGVNGTIPINIVEVDVDQTGANNVNISVNTNIQPNNIQTNINNTSTTNNNQSNNEQVKEEKKEQNEVKEKVEENKEKPKEDNKLRSIPNTTQNNNNPPNTQNNTQNNTQTTNQNVDFNNLFGNMMSQLMTPSNLNSLAGAVGSMLNNSGGNQSGSGGNNQGMGGVFGNLLSNLMGSFGDDSDEEEESTTQKNPPPQTQTQPQTQEKDKKEFITPKEDTSKKEETNNINNNSSTPNTTTTTKSGVSLIKKLVESPLLRRETKISDESKIGEKMEPNIEFIPFSNEIIANLTVQEIFNIYNFNFSGLSRLRKDIQNKFFKDKAKNDENVKKVIELLCERFILVENQIDKLNPNKDFNIEEFLNKHLKNILNMFIDDNEVNQPDSKWEDKFRKLVIDMLISLINEVKEVYETGEDGAKTFIEFNILTLIENFVGQKYLALIQSYDEDIVNKYVENLFTIVKAEEIKEKCKEEKSDNKVNENERPNLLSIEEIFRIASKDKEKLEKEEKENSEENKSKKYSEFYYLTSLFKN